MTDLMIALGLLGLYWALLSMAHRALAAAPETSWLHRGGFVQAVALTSTGLLAVGVVLLLHFMATAGTTVAVATAAGLVAVPVAVWLLKRQLRRHRGGDASPGAPAV